MAQVSSKCLFFFLLQLILSLCSSGTQVGFSYNARGSIASSSISRTLSFLELNKVTETHIRVLVADNRVLSKLSNSNVSVDLYLDESFVENFINSRSSAIFWLKSNVVAFLPNVRIKSITIRGENDLSKLLSNLKLTHSVLSTFDLGNDEIKVSVEFSLSFLENLNGTQKSHIFKVFEFIKKIESYVIVESDISNVNGVELRMGDLFIKAMVEKAMFVTSTIRCSDVDIVMIVKGLVDLSANEVSEFADKFSKPLEKNTEIASQIVELYADVSSTEDFTEKELEREKEQIFPPSRRELLKTTSRDLINPPETVPTPTIVTVPATNPVNPTNPATTPVSIPSTTPVVVPPTIPSVNPPAPVTTPPPVTVPGGQPITNPVTTYPSPPGNVPVTTPPASTNSPPGNVPVTTPPASTNAPATPGQSWCVAKSGVSETALQQALDYACGTGGADCSQIQQSGSCYNPNTLQNHASFAFNSYYQKNPAATSCDFGGAASIVSSNPSTGSCVFPSSSSSSSSSSLPTPTPTPTSSTTNPVTTPSTPTNPAAIPPPTAAGGSSGNVTPPSVLNSSSPGLGSPAIFPSDSPPGISTTSKSTKLHPSPTTGCFFLITYFIAKRIIIHV